MSPEGEYWKTVVAGPIGDISLGELPIIGNVIPKNGSLIGSSSFPLILPSSMLSAIKLEWR